MASEPIAAQAMVRLERLSRRANRVSKLATAMREGLAQRAEGIDDASAVRVGIDRDGVPSDVRVLPRWRRRIAATDLADAILAAATAAVAARLRAWSDDLERTSFHRRVATLANGVDDVNDQAAFPGSPVAVTQIVNEAPRDLSQVIEGILAALRAARTRTGGRSEAVIGWDSSHNVSLTLSAAGLQDCYVEPEWASRQDDDVLTRALSSALSAARAKLAGPTGPDDAVDDLATAALTVLHRLQGDTDLARRDGK